MPRHWFIKTRSGKAGPLTSKMLVRLVGEGKIKPNMGVSPDGESWVKVNKILGLSFPETEPTRWYVQTKHGNAGPFTLPKLQKLARAGRIRPNFAVSRDCGEWIQAKLVPGLLFPKPIDAAERAAGSNSNRPAVTTKTKKPRPGVKIEPLESQWGQLREAEYLRRFGPVAEVRRNGDSSEPAIDISVHPPTAERPFTTLVTSGMSDHPMPVPSGACSPRAELVLYVDQMHRTYIDLLRFLAQFPHREKAWLSYGSQMNNGNPAQLIFEGSLLESYAFMIPNIESDFKIHESLRIDNEPLQLLWVVPITRAERELITEHGMKPFCELLDRNHHSLLIDPSRRCYANRASRLVG